MKTCTDCEQTKELELFSTYKYKDKTYYKNRCKKCTSRRNAERNKERYDNDPEYRERLKQYRKDNPDKVAKWKRKEYEENREDYLRRASEWRESNRATRRQINRRYKAKRSEWELNGSYSQQEWDDLLDTHRHQCLACGRVDLPLTADHVIPLSKGGPNTIDNIQPLCGPCNSSKATKTIDYRR